MEDDIAIVTVLVDSTKVAKVISINQKYKFIVNY